MFVSMSVNEQLSLCYFFSLNVYKTLRCNLARSIEIKQSLVFRNSINEHRNLEKLFFPTGPVCEICRQFYPNGELNHQIRTTHENYVFLLY